MLNEPPDTVLIRKKKTAGKNSARLLIPAFGKFVVIQLVIECHRHQKIGGSFIYLMQQGAVPFAQGDNRIAVSNRHPFVVGKCEKREYVSYFFQPAHHVVTVFDFDVMKKSNDFATGITLFNSFGQQSVIRAIYKNVIGGFACHYGQSFRFHGPGQPYGITLQCPAQFLHIGQDTHSEIYTVQVIPE